MSNTHEVLGVPLTRFRDPIHLALQAYQGLTDGLEFDLDSASRLGLTPTKPNTARSQTPTVYRGQSLGDLFVILFKSGDGTGDESETRKLRNLRVAHPYPRNTRVVPRDKRGIHSEVYLPLASHEVDNASADPILYAGRCDLLGLSGKRVLRVGDLGHEETAEDIGPLALLTVGYLDGLRIGDPHAVFNSSAQIVVCAFLSISDALYDTNQNLLRGLNPQVPSLSVRG